MIEDDTLQILHSEEKSLTKNLVPFLSTLVRWEFNEEGTPATLDNSDGVRFLQDAQEFLLAVINGDIPLPILPDANQKYTELLTELQEFGFKQDVTKEDKFQLSQTMRALMDVIGLFRSGYRTMAREAEQVFTLNLTADGQLVPGSTTEVQRRDAVAMQRIMWAFVRRHPNLPVVNQLLLDWLHSIQASDQSSNSTYTQYREANKHFYEEYTRFMNAHAGTISSADVERVAGIIEYLHSQDIPLESVYFGGSGTMDRFERKLLDRLKAKNIEFREILAFDSKDFGQDAARHAREGKFPITFRQGDLLDPPVTEDKRYSVVLYPWSVLCDIMPRLDVIRAFQQAAAQVAPDGVVITDQPLPVGEHSYRDMREEQAVERGEEGAIGRTYKMGADGPDLWKDLNIMGLADICLTAAQAGLTPMNLPQTVPELYAFMHEFEDHEAEYIEQSQKGANTDAMESPAYHTSGWNRVTIVFQNVGVEEALRRAHTGSSLLHKLLSSAMGKSEDGLK